LAVSPSLQNKKMPYQCELSWQVFQVVYVLKVGKRWLMELCRPERCPYCKQYHTMICHGYVERYIILLNSITITLIIPVFQCEECKHTIRVLPRELHSHCNHLAETIKDHIITKLETGRYTGKKRVPKSLQRQWYNHYLKRCQEIMQLREGMDIKKIIKQLPPFSILFRSNYRTVRESDPEVFHRRTHRILPLTVCLDSS
jgi:hypothetical protein